MTGFLVTFGTMLAVIVIGSKIFDIDDWKRR